MNVRETKSGRAELELEGAVNFETVPALRKKIFRIAKNPRVAEVDVDLSAVGEINTAGIAMLVELMRILSKRGGKLKLVGASERVRRIIHLSRLDRLFELE